MSSPSSTTSRTPPGRHVPSVPPVPHYGGSGGGGVSSSSSSTSIPPPQSSPSSSSLPSFSYPSTAFLPSSPYHSPSANQQIVVIDDALIQYVSEVAITPASMKSLSHLDLHLRGENKGKIRKIENLNKCIGLRFLNLSYNAITKIEGLDALPNLVELNLAENAIRQIENLDGLRMLERLNVSGNQIQRISPNLLVLKNLNMFRIARNDLKVLDDIALLRRLPALSHLRFDENPISRHEHGGCHCFFQCVSFCCCVSYAGLIYLSTFKFM